MITYRDVLSNETALRFKEASKEYGSYCKVKSSPPSIVFTRFKQALQEYRDYLDTIGFYMKSPKKRKLVMFLDEK